MAETQFKNPKTVAPPFGPYSHAALVPAGRDMLFMSGQLGVRSDGSLPTTFEEQADIAYANVVAVLKDFGLTPANLVKITILAVAGYPLEAIRVARARHLGDAQPASTLMYAPQLAMPDYLIEVEAIAAR